MTQKAPGPSAFETLTAAAGQTVKPIADEAKALGETAKQQIAGEVGSNEQGQQPSGQTQSQKQSQATQMKQQADQQTQAELSAVRSRFFQKRKQDFEQLKPIEKQKEEQEKKEEEEKKVQQFKVVEKKQKEQKKADDLSVSRAKTATEARRGVAG